MGSVKIIILAFVIATFSIAGCTNNENVTRIDSQEFEELKEENVFVVKTHTPYEGEIPGTDLIIEDWENIQLYEDLLPEDKDAKILVYCMSGRMSSSASRQITELGYKNVYDLSGGMLAWQAAGKEIIFEER